MPSNNLTPGQYQIGDLVMGPLTPFKIESIDIGNYDVNVQDYQASSSNEMRFGQDTLKPAPLQLTINVLKNRILPNVAAIAHYSGMPVLPDDPKLGDLQREWRAEETLSQWGVIKPLLFCGGDLITRRFYGRPGKFAYKKHWQVNSLYYICQAEFRRSDTYAYSDIEYFVVLNPSESQTITRINGDATTWVRFLIVGPATDPIINLGSKQIELNYTIPAGMVVEISSYPWERRVVTNTGLSLAAYIVSDRPYLDTIRFPFNVATSVSWHATGTTSASKMSFLWRDAYNVME